MTDKPVYFWRSDMTADDYATRMKAWRERDRARGLPVQVIGQGGPVGQPWEPPPPKSGPWKWACPCGMKFRNRVKLVAHINLCPKAG